MTTLAYILIGVIVLLLILVLVLAANAHEKSEQLDKITADLVAIKKAKQILEAEKIQISITTTHVKKFIFRI